jgi:hypothetical protein
MQRAMRPLNFAAFGATALGSCQVAFDLQQLEVLLEEAGEDLVSFRVSKLGFWADMGSVSSRTRCHSQVLHQLGDGLASFVQHHKASFRHLPWSSCLSDVYGKLDEFIVGNAD